MKIIITEAVREAAKHREPVQSYTIELLNECARFRDDEQLKSMIATLDNNEQRRIKFTIDRILELLPTIESHSPEMHRWLRAIERSI